MPCSYKPGVCYERCSNAATLLEVLFCILTLLLNFGPSLGTYVLPALCFPTTIRSTCHGLSSTGGKIGAVIGTLIFEPISESPLYKA